jgi:hypothetical protein
MGRRASKPPPLANPAAAAQLERAAAAAGLSVGELADLVFESGVVPPKAADGGVVVQRYTLAELGTRLWGTMQGVPRDARAGWFAELLPVQRTSVIVVLRDQGFRSEVIARDLGITIAEVMRTWSAYSSELGSQVLGVRLDTLAGQLQLAKERTQQMAIEQGDHRSVWAIEKQFVEILQSIGVVERATHRMEVTHKIDDEQRAEIEKIAELRNKQSRRKLEVEEIKQIEAKGDAVPTEVATADYDDEDDDE